jgi:hypothetical protein
LRFRRSRAETIQLKDVAHYKAMRLETKQKTAFDGCFVQNSSKCGANRPPASGFVAQMRLM